MEAIEVMQVLTQGEDSRNQFKLNITNEDALAFEMVAFSNTEGGRIFVGVSDDGTDIGLSTDDVRRINQMLSNAASQNVRPAVNPLSEVVSVNEHRILVITVPKGINKPYQDKNGAIWVKCGADKRKATLREELQRLFQASGLIHADTMPANGLMISDLDMPYFRRFYQSRYGESLDRQTIPLAQTIANMNLGQNDMLNLAGALLFAQNPSFRLPMYIVRGVAFPGNEITTEEYLDNRDLTGKMSDIFQQTVSFILSHLNRVQGEQSVNSVGELEIPRIVIEELVANALVHRDYYVAAPVRVIIFSDRIEIISPGHLPNQLTVENIKTGNSVARNPVIASFAPYVLPYRGLGSGILRSIQSWPHIDFIDDRSGNQFRCVIWRRGPV